ncbi:MAG: DUF333 domain-containing protein [Patescibacteria group bacterium]
MLKVIKKKELPYYKILFLVILPTIVLTFLVFLFLTKHYFSSPTAQTFTGTFPCADCSGIATTLTLTKPAGNPNYGTFTQSEVYEGKNMQPFVTEGKWWIDREASKEKEYTILVLESNKNKTYYQINNDKITLLDQNQQPIDSPFNETLTVVDSQGNKKNSNSKLSNPASEYCIEKGGDLVIQTRGDGGEYGLCQFEDNQACEEWALYRGECPIGGVKTTGYDTIEQQYCAWVGGKTLAEQDATCTLPNGNVCDDAALYNGTCQ